MLKDLLRTADLDLADIERVLEYAQRSKDDPYGFRHILEGDTAVLYFNKPSTRTRLSLETAVARLGGVPIMVGPNDLQLGRGETIEDTAEVMSRYARAITIRTYSDDEVRRFAKTASVPVVNALTDGHHPCQSLADLQTLLQRFGDLSDVVIAYVGDGNNVAHSLLEAAAIVGMEMRVATPPGYEVEPEVVEVAKARAALSGAKLIFTDDAKAAVEGVQAIYTDTWVSMGDPDEERAKRLHDLEPYQVNDALMDLTRPEAIFMHCLPDHRGEEVTAEVVDGPRSVVFDQAENRLHAAVGILYAVLAGRLEGYDPS
ncbi:MAG: ornithine carbamoyltransferase [Planctomycetota bacterium]|nr:ornithine carbamoyltransferase [Planctomycetota bacterium]